MTWPWRICFSLLALGPLWAAPVTGTVRLSDSRDPAVRKRSDFSGVVVWLEPIHAAEQTRTAPPQPARMEQKNKRFIPHVLAIEAGATVSFPNYDPIYHNAFSNYGGQIFDLGLYPPGASRSVAFSRPGIVHVFCNIHPTMNAVIVVLRWPWFTVSNAMGAYTIAGVPPGDYRLHVFHERAAAATLLALERRITVPAEGAAVAAMTISETGYVESAHKNKYGLDYPPAANDLIPYPTRPR
jgi:plastocyanin